MTTTKPTPIAATPPTGPAFCLPDPPEDHESKVTSFIHLAGNGNAHHLAMHLGNLDTTLVGGERYVVTRTTQSMAGSHYPDLLVAFDVNPGRLQRPQRVHHRGARETAGLCPGDSVAQYRAQRHG